MVSQVSDLAASSAYAVSASTAGSSPWDALNDIDWVSPRITSHLFTKGNRPLILLQNEIDQLFGGAERGTGNMMIPPFTFPQFSATDLQWPQEGFQ
jgi:hypothetical protein